LRSLTEKERVDQQLNTAQSLVHWLGYLPLGLELVGRYLAQKPDLSLVEMQKRLKQQKFAARALVKREEGMTATHESVAAAFELSWQELDEPVRQLCYLLSLFALAPIPWELVQSCLSDWDEEDLEDTRDLGLVNRSLLQRLGEGSYQLHQLIREFFAAKLERLDVVDELKRQYCLCMVGVAQQVPLTMTQDLITSMNAAMPHVAEAATTLQDWLEDEDLIWPYVGLGRFYQGQGAYAQALPYYELCLSITQARLGQEHPYVANSLNNLALLYRDQGRYSEAEPLLLQALEMRQRLLGQEHPYVAQSLNNLAGLYSVQGRYSEAEPLFIQALELRQRLLGQEHPDVATSLNNLA
jgi:tetratricopeptide (TPR) repeat protein